jgi:hypothetical protein
MARGEVLDGMIVVPSVLCLMKANAGEAELFQKIP